MADLGAFDMRSGSSRNGFRAGMGASRSAFPEVYKLQGMQERAAIGELHAPATKAEREQRERGKEYERMKAQLAAARAASDADVSVSPTTTNKDTNR